MSDCIQFLNNVMFIPRHRYIQRGRGWGNIFGKIARSIIPFVSNIGKKVITSPIAKRVGKTAVDTLSSSALSLAADAIGGDADISESLKRELTKVRRDVAGSLRPQEKKNKKRKIRKVVSSKKIKHSKQQDIFSNDDTDGS